MRQIGLAAAVALVCGLADAAAPYSIKVTARPTGKFTVQVSVTTNLPDAAVLSGSLGLANQKPDDTFIGTGFQEIAIKGGKASFVIDGSKRVMPMNSALPAGLYDVEVSFHPLWAQNRALAAKLNLSDSLAGVAQVRLGGSGASVASAKKKQEAQRWVMMNVNIGDKWDSSFYTKKFGAYRELPLASGNPRILKMYYFPQIDMTFMVNVYKGEIAVWRMGKANR